MTQREVVKEVTKGVEIIWAKTDIPAMFKTDPYKAEKEILKVVRTGYQLLRTPIARRKENFGDKLKCLLDLAAYHHINEQVWLSTIPHPVVSLEEIYTREIEKKHKQIKMIREAKQDKARLKSKLKVEDLKRKVTLETSSEDGTIELDRSKHDCDSELDWEAMEE